MAKHARPHKHNKKEVEANGQALKRRERTTLMIRTAILICALGSLENWHMLQRRAHSWIVVNPLICFKGNGDLQQEALEQLRQDARAALRKRFPEMREDVVALEKAVSESFPEFTAPAAPAPRTRQLAFGDNDVEGSAC